ncbi:MAG: DUF2490 domain-containing protein [Sphingobacteriales bacterium]|nr:MAG: DUF2490 domain-containing protein [Sphingobacteriales bacterium]
MLILVILCITYFNFICNLFTNHAAIWLMLIFIKLKIRFILSIILLLFVNNVFAQNNSLGTWNVFNLKYTLKPKWSVFGEAQMRSLKLYDNFHYYEYKGGVNYKLEKNVKVSFAAGSYQTYSEMGNFGMPKNNNEFRIWPQLILFQSIGKIKIEQRYRAELRFTTNGYRNRFRYRFGVSYPFGKEKDNYKPFQISTSNELFFTNNEPYFERNRMLTAFNYKPNKTTTLQVGYLHQLDYKIKDETGRDFLQVGLFVEIFKSQNSSDTELKDN